MNTNLQFFSKEYMTFCRMIAPNWLIEQDSTKRRVLEGMFSTKDIQKFNAEGYNIYTLPNHPKTYPTNKTVDGTDIDTFEWVFVDCDLKDQVYSSKDEFITKVGELAPSPTKIVDSGGGIHVYWKVSDLDAKSYLRFQRRLLRLLHTDEAVGQIFQLMRLPDTKNTKKQHNATDCILLFEDTIEYTSEELNKLLPPITTEDEAYCIQHYERTYNLNQTLTQISDKMPAKWGRLLSENVQAKELFANISDDRSKNDYRLGHILHLNGFTEEEGLTVLANTAKALTRAPIHQLSYAKGIVEKIWTFKPSDQESLSMCVADLLDANSEESLKGQRFPCQRFFDGTEHGFRLTQVIGLCAGVGVGKTAIGLNLFKGFVEQNPGYIHMFVSLEQPAREIAGRWKKMCGTNTTMHNAVHVISNYNADGSYRNLSLTEIQNYIIKFKEQTGLQVGCVCIDHIAVLKQEKRPGEYQGLSDICSQLKSFAMATNTLLVIQSQTSRDKAGIGDLELDKGAAYGTQSFESYLDFLLVAWQPLKRCYSNKQCPRVTAYKFAKVRFKSKNDFLLEDECYRLLFDQDTETLHPMTQEDEVSFDFFAKLALNARKLDKKTDLVRYSSIRWKTEEEGAEKDDAETDNSGQPRSH